MKSENHRQNCLIALCWILYTGVYLGRYCYNSNINQIMAFYGAEHSDAGLVTTCFFFAYGAGQIINGLFCKRYRAKYVLGGALFFSALFNLAVFFAGDFRFIKYLWLLNGFAQSFVWSSLMLVLGKNLSRKNLKRAVLVMSTSTAAGTLITYGISALLALFGGFRFSFLIGCFALVTIALLWLCLFDKYTAKGEEKESEEEEQRTSLPSAPDRRTGNSALIIVVLLGFFAIVNNLIKDGLTTWVPSILKEEYALSDSLSIVLTLALPVLAVFGSAVSMLLNSRIKDFIAVAGLLFCGAALSIFGVTCLLDKNYWAVLVFSAVVSCLMSGVNNIITSMAPLYLRERFNAGRIAGLLNGCCYMGSTISSYGLGIVADKGGWNQVFSLLLITACFPVVCSGVYFLARKIKEKGKKNTL